MTLLGSPSYDELEMWKAVQDGAPPVISWFINPMNTIVIYSYTNHKPLNSATYKATERYLGGPIQ